MLAPLLAVIVGMFATVAAVRRHRRLRLPGRSVIISPRKSTVIDDSGAVRSVQSAEITLSEADLARLWTPVNLQNLARTYWRFLSRVTLGIVRVSYGPQQRSVKLVWPPVTLLRFNAPEYSVERDRGHVRWRIRDGLLVARGGRSNGFLALDVRRLDAPGNGSAKLRIEVEVANFYPSIASNFSMPAYKATQAFLHVLVTHSFLRSLAALDLAQSRLEPFAVAGAPLGELAPASDGGSRNGHAHAAADQPQP